MANSSAGAGATQGRTFKGNRPPLFKRVQKKKIYPPLVELGTALLEGAVLGATEIFWERVGTPGAELVCVSNLAATKPLSHSELFISPTGPFFKFQQ